MYGLLLSLIAGLSTMLGTIFIFFNIEKPKRESFITYCLSISLSIMILLSLFDLIPEALNIFKFKTYLIGVLSTIFYLFIGYVLIILINNILIKNISKNSLYKLGILNMIALILHNLPEGILTLVSSYKDINLGIKISIGIMLHNIPEGIAIAIPIYYSTNSKYKALLYTLISGLSEVLGSLLALILIKKYISYNLISIILLIVAGIMITLSIEEILPIAKKFNKDKYIIYGIITSIIIFFINKLIF